MNLNQLNQWQRLIADILNQQYFKDLMEWLDEKYKSKSTTINPSKEHVFRAFELTSPEAVRVVILGQDPYPNPAHAMGLSFSIPPGTKMPPTLKNILKELESDIGPEHQVADGDLISWAKQGVLLMNTALTVEAGEPGSHKALWEGFSENILLRFDKLQRGPVAYLLWGKQAEQIGKILEQNTPKDVPRIFLYSVHPSPLSAYRGFFGSKPFSKINAFLTENGAAPISW